MLHIFDDNAVTIESEKGQVKLSTIIRNCSGALVAEIIKNDGRQIPSTRLIGTTQEIRSK